MRSAGIVQCVTQAELLAWAQAGEQCQLTDLRLTCLKELARRLAANASKLPTSFADAAALVEHCDKSTLAVLLGLLAQACGPSFASRIASPAAADEALQDAANLGGFEWVLERFSQQPAAVGQFIYSPYFTGGGKEWRLKVYPGGDTEKEAGHLSGKYSMCRALAAIPLLDFSLSTPLTRHAGPCCSLHLLLLRIWQHHGQVCHHSG